MLSTQLEPRLPQTSDQPVSQPSSDSLNGLPSLRGLESLLDVLTSFLAFALVCAVSRTFPMRAAHGSLKHLAEGGLIFSFLVTLLLDRSGAYRPSGGLLRVRETASVLEASALSFLFMAVTVAFLGVGGGLKFVLLTVSMLTVSLLLQKQLMHAAIDALRQGGYGLRRVLIYGAGSSAKMLFSALARSPKLGLLPVAIVDDDHGQESTQVYESESRKKRSLIKLSTSFQASLIKAYQADIVVVATRPGTEQGMRFVLEESAKAGTPVAFAADITSQHSALVDYIELDGQILYGTHSVGPRYLHLVVSRALDLLISSILLVLVGPIFLLISVLIKLDSPGSVFFHQVRVGKDGKLFTIYKFRSMHEECCGDGISPTSSEDRRITRVGRWLRRTSIDEIPQLLNILKGEMALVGPRPEMPFIVAQYSDTERLRLSVKPGLTGLWQISADRCRPIHENIQYDLYYLKNRSSFMDIAILFHTLLFAMHGT